MGVSLIDHHPSFMPVTDLFAVWDDATATLTTPDHARANLLLARQQIKTRQDGSRLQRLTAQSWGTTPEHARRYVLFVAGLSMTRWESPIHSFKPSERAAIKAAVVASVGMFERVMHAV
ncbi:hypothetical protein QN360_13105 [Glaciimonas sp. CA11.2]|nr:MULTISPECIES: hypothetical protein [unclassified Glaciimonas]MDY7547246.1 hypothetical protein [Glaciimonas sp. CA11.2]MEB0012595.1 hypothetical protein [Glaciimonas sp. Cout2]MEB0083946.1 hypothetical protein [Glaciimonas sp. Gout2]MEB0163841.1 hypothetical protein [Glaciimonas sp. CA11.2]